MFPIDEPSAKTVPLQAGITLELRSPAVDAHAFEMRREILSRDFTCHIHFV
jgi:hypothetical protein